MGQRALKLFLEDVVCASDDAYIKGYSNLEFGNWWLKGMIFKGHKHSLSCHNCSKAFGPVVNCIISISTGISLSCHMNYHGETLKDMLTSNLMIIHDINNPNSTHFPGVTIHGDRCYNDNILCLLRHWHEFYEQFKAWPNTCLQIWKLKV